MRAIILSRDVRRPCADMAGNLHVLLLSLTGTSLDCRGLDTSTSMPVSPQRACLPVFAPCCRKTSWVRDAESLSRKALSLHYQSNVEARWHEAISRGGVFHRHGLGLGPQPSSWATANLELSGAGYGTVWYSIVSYSTV